MSKDKDWKDKLYVDAATDFFGSEGHTEEKYKRVIQALREDGKIKEGKIVPVKGSAVPNYIFLLQSHIAIERLEERNKKLVAHNDKLEREIDELRKVADMNNEKAQEQIKELRTHCNKLSTWYADLENKCRTL